MTNPVSTNQPFAMPPIDTPVIETGSFRWNNAWYQLLITLFARTGGASGANASTAQTTATQALLLANTAEATATNAQTLATTAQTTANTAVASAATAQTTANGAVALAGSVQGTSAKRTNNLSDLSSASTARSNLGINTGLIQFMFQNMPGPTQALFYAVPAACTIPANFLGTLTRCRVVPTADAQFFLYKISSGGAMTSLGSVLLIHAGQFASFSTQAAIPLVAGDILELIAPSAQDSTLEDAMIAIPYSLT